MSARGLALKSKELIRVCARIEAAERESLRSLLFARVKDDGRAKSALIAVAGIMRKGGAP